MGGPAWGVADVMTRSDMRMFRLDDQTPSWVIVDRLIAPTTPGRYVLQWRWDNDQTPQIWTTCADVIVAEGPLAVLWWWVAVPVLGAVLLAASLVVCNKAMRKKSTTMAPAPNKPV